MKNTIKVVALLIALIFTETILHAFDVVKEGKAK